MWKSSKSPLGKLAPQDNDRYRRRLMVELLEDRTLLSGVSFEYSSNITGPLVYSGTPVSFIQAVTVPQRPTTKVDTFTAELKTIGFPTGISISTSPTVITFGPVFPSTVSWVVSFSALGVSPGTYSGKIKARANIPSVSEGNGSDVTLIVSINKPPIANAGGPYTINEGQSVTLDASKSTDPNNDPLTYSWDVNGDGIFGDVTGVKPTLSWSQLNALAIADGPRTISNLRVRVNDGFNPAVDSPVTTLTITNVAPTVTFTGPTEGVRTLSQTWFLGANDPSPIDQAAGFTFRTNWGEGDSAEVINATPGNGTSIPIQHAFRDRGTYTIQATATDKDTGVSAPKTQSVVIKAAGLLPDPADSSKTALFIVGSLLADTIELLPGTSDAALVEVYLTEGAGPREFLGSFTPTGQIIILPRDGNDQVIVRAGITHPIRLDDANGTDSLTIMGTDAADDFRTQSNSLTINGQSVSFSGIDSQNLVAGQGNDKLTGPNTDNTWNLNGAGSGNLNTTTAFSGFENLAGGNAQDTFAVSAAASLSGNLDGGSGSDTVVVTRDADFELSNNLLVVSGGPTLQLQNVENAILTGGPSANTFKLTNWTGGGRLDGNGGADRLVYSNSASYSLSTDAQNNLNGVTVNGVTTQIASVEEFRLQATAGTGSIDATAFKGDLTFEELGTGNITVLGGQGKNVFVKRPEDSGTKRFVGGAGNNQFRIGPGSNVELVADPNAHNELSFDLANTPIVFNLAAPGTEQSVNDRGDTVTFTGRFDVVNDSQFNDVFIAPLPEVDPNTNAIVSLPTTIVANQGIDSLFGTLSTNVIARGGNDFYFGLLEKEEAEAAINEFSNNVDNRLDPGLKEFALAAFDKAVLAGFDANLLAAFNDVVGKIDPTQVNSLRTKVFMEGDGNLALTGFLTSVEFGGANNFLIGRVDDSSRDFALAGISSFEDALSGGFDGVLATGFQNVLNVGFNDLLSGGFDGALAAGFAGQIAPTFDALLGQGFDDVLAQGFDATVLAAFEDALGAGFESTLLAGFDDALQTAFDVALAGGFNDVLAGGFDDALAGGFEDALQAAFDSTLQTAFDDALAQSFDGVLVGAFQDALRAQFEDLLAGGFENTLHSGFDGLLAGGFEQVLAGGFDSILVGAFDGLLGSGFDAVLNVGFDNVLGAGFDDLLGAGFDSALTQAFAGELSAGFDSVLASSFDATLGLSFADVLARGYDGALKTFFGDPLDPRVASFANTLLTGFEDDLAGGFEAHLLASFDDALQQAFDDALAGGFDDVLSGGFEDVVAQGFQAALQRSFDNALQAAFEDALALAFDGALAAGYAPQQSVAFEDALRAGFESLLAAGFDSTLGGGFEGVLAGGFDSALAGGFDSLLSASFDSLLSSSFDNVLASGFDNLLDAGFDQALASGFEGILATGFDEALAAGFDAELLAGYQGALPVGADAAFADALLADFQADLAGGFVNALQAGFDDALQAAFDALLAGGFSTVLAGGFDNALAGGFEETLAAGFEDALQAAFDDALQQAFAGPLQGNEQAQDFADALAAGFDQLLAAGFEDGLLSGFDGVLMAGFADILGQGFDDLLSQGFDSLLGTGFEDSLATGFDDLLGAGFENALAGGFDGALAAGFGDVLSTGFEDILANGFQGALGTTGNQAFADQLLAGFEGNLASGFEDALQASFDSALQQAFEDVMAGGFEVALAGGFDDTLAGAFEAALQAGFGNALQQAFDDALQLGFEDALRNGFSLTEAQAFEDALRAGFEDMLTAGFDDAMLTGFDGTLASGFANVLAGGFDDVLATAFADSLGQGFDDVLDTGFENLLGAGFDSALATGFEDILATGFDNTLTGGFETTLANGYQGALPAGADQAFADALLAGFESDLAGGFVDALQSGFEDALQQAFDGLLAGGFAAALAGGFDDLLAQGFEDALEAGFEDALQAAFDTALQQAFDGPLAGHSQAQAFADALQAGFDGLLASGFETALATGFEGTLTTGFADVLAGGFDGILVAAFDNQMSGGFDDMLAAGFDDLVAGGFDVALVGHFDDVLQPGFEDTLAGGFEDILATGYQTSLVGSFGGTLNQGFADQLLAGFEANLASGFEDVVQTGFAAALQQSFDDAYAAGFDSALVGGFEDTLAGGFEDLVQAGFSAALQQSFDDALQQAFDQALAAGFTTTQAQQFADALQAGFGNLSAAGFESELAAGFEGQLASGFHDALANGFEDTLRGGFADRLAVPFVESLLDALRMKITVHSDGNIIKAGLLANVTMIGSNNLYIGDTSASAQTLVSSILGNFASGIEKGSAATLFDGIRSNVTLLGNNNVARAGLFTTITMGDGPDLFVEKLTPSDISLLENTLATLGSTSDEVRAALLDGFSVNVNMGDGNDLAVGGLLARVQGGAGADTFVIQDPVLLGAVAAGSPQAAFVNTLPGGTFEGGLGSDTYSFLGEQIGAVKVGEAPVSGVDSDTDLLDFSGYQGGPIHLDLARTDAQILTAGKLTLTLSSSDGLEDVVGTSWGDVIQGNDRPNHLSGADNQGDDRITTVHGFQPGRETVVFLDFSGVSTTRFSQDNPELVEDYTTAEREQIRDLMAGIYTGFHYTFTLTQPTSGPYTRVIFNQTPEGGNPGGHSNEIDLRNVNRGENPEQATVVIDINGFLGGPGQPALTSANAVQMSANLAAHEVAHASGVVHSDSMGPIGRGIHLPPGIDRFLPTYPGLVQAFETPQHVIASPASVGSSLFDVVGTTFFGERELIKLAFAENWTDVGPDANVVSEGNLPSTSVTIGGTTVTAHDAGELPGLEVPNTMLKGLNANKTFDVAAMTVLGNIEIDPATGRSDSAFIAFKGRAGDLINIQVVSVGMARLANPVDPVARVYGPDGQLMPFYAGVAVNDDDFDGGLSNIVDLTLPSYGPEFTDAEGNFTFYLEVDTFTFLDNPNFTPEQIEQFRQDPSRADACNDTDIGTFEAYITRFTVKNTTDGDDILSGRGGVNVLDGGAGYDTVLEVGDVDFNLNDQSLNGIGVNTLSSIENAILTGGAGDNKFYFDGWSGAAQFNGGDGIDTLRGLDLGNTWQITGQNAGSLNDNVTFSGMDNLSGGSLGDTFLLRDGQGVSGTVDGRGGINTLDYSAYTTAVTVDLASGQATGSGGVSNVQNVIGGSGNDTIFGDEQNNNFSGGAGDDILSGRGGVNTFDGGTGNDTVLEVGDVDFTLTNQSLVGTGSDALANIESADLTGGASANKFVLSNWTGDGQVNGGGATDTLVGPNIDNSWQISGQNAGVVNSKLAFSAVENLVGGTAGDIFIFGDGKGVSGKINGGGGVNALDYSAYTTPVTVDLGNSLGTGTLGLAGIRHVLGGSAADIIIGDAQDNILFGGGRNDTINGADGNDVIAGQNGSDSLSGGSGNDQFLFGNSTAETDTVIGGSGTDILDYSGNQNVPIDFGSYEFTFAARATGITVNLNQTSQAIGGGSNLVLPNLDVENVYGTNTHDNILGNTANNVLLGLAGNDTLVGGAGDDILLGGAGDDNLVGSSGHDLVVGGFGADRIDASSGDDVIVGGIIFQNLANPNLGVYFDQEELDVLALAMQTWLNEINNNDLTNADTADDILALLGAANDSAIDQLTGSSGVNLFIVASDDIITDFDFNSAMDTSAHTGLFESKEYQGDVVIYLD